MDAAQEKCQLVPQRYGLVFFCVCAAVFVLDQWTKYAVDASMSVGQTIELPVRFVQLTYVRNYGGAFGMMEGASLLFIASALLTLGVIYFNFPFICKRIGYAGSVICAGIAAGALGNMADRIRIGYVIDMIDLKCWPVFNVADIGVSVGIVVFAVWMLVLEKNAADYDDGAKEGAGGADADAEKRADSVSADMSSASPSDGA